MAKSVRQIGKKGNIVFLSNAEVKIDIWKDPEFREAVRKFLMGRNVSDELLKYDKFQKLYFEFIFRPKVHKAFAEDRNLNVFFRKLTTNIEKGLGFGAAKTAPRRSAPARTARRPVRRRPARRPEKRRPARKAVRRKAPRRPARRRR